MAGGPGSYVLGAEERKEVLDVLDGGNLFRYGTPGVDGFQAKVVTFENEMAERLGHKHVVATSSGTGSLMCCLAALGIGMGDEVIVPGYTFIASIATIAMMNATSPAANSSPIAIAAAIAIVKLLLSAGFKNITMCDRTGAIYAGREKLNWIKEEMAQVTNLQKETGKLSDVIRGADVFIGVSAPNTVTTEMVKTMNKDAIIFACANPTPEIFPDAAKAGGARVISTGRSDYPNQINNVLAFPGIFRGAFDVRASDINEEMKMAAAQALADLVSPEELSADYIIPTAFDKRVGPAVAKAVAEAARRSGVARI